MPIRQGSLSSLASPTGIEGYEQMIARSAGQCSFIKLRETEEKLVRLSVPTFISGYISREKRASSLSHGHGRWNGVMTQVQESYTFGPGRVPPSPEGVGIIIGDAVMVILSTVWTILRVYSRRRKGLSLLTEDYMHLAALLFFYGTIVISVGMVLNGMGRHMSEISPDHVVTILKYSFASQVLYALSLGLIKISICWALGRIFIIPWVTIGARILMALSFAWGLMTILIGLFICRPVKMNWDSTTPGGKCGNMNAAYASVSIVDLIVDFLILLLPIAPVLKLQLPRANKLGLLAIFSGGILTMIFCAVRLAAVTSVDFADFPYSARMSHIWTVSENGVALIVASSIYLRPVFDRVFSALKSLGSSVGITSKGRSGATGTKQSSSHRIRTRSGNYKNLTGEMEMNNVPTFTKGQKQSIYVQGGKSEDSMPVEDGLSSQRIYVTTDFTTSRSEPS